MNNGIFRLVFNRERGAWMAVAEFVRGHGKGTCKARAARRRVALALLAAVALDAAAAPRLPAGTVPVPVNAGGAGSLTEVSPDTASTHTLRDDQTFTKSEVRGADPRALGIRPDAGRSRHARLHGSPPPQQPRLILTFT